MRTNGRYLTLAEQPSGIVATLTDEGREELADNLASHPEWNDWQQFLELFADFLGNGWDALPPEQIGALTGCELILGWDVQRDDQGNVTAAGAVFWHERYAVESATEQLQAGKLFLLRA